MKNEDDERSVDWAPKKIKELEERLKTWMLVAERADQGVKDLPAQVERMSENTTLRMDGHARRIARLDNKISELTGRMRLVEDYIRQLDMSAQEAAVEAPAFEDFGPVIGGTERSVSFDIELNPENRAKLGGLFADQEHGGVVRDGQEAVERITGMEAVRKEQYDRGFAAGQVEQAPKSFRMGQDAGHAQALQVAEARVRAYMDGHFSKATIVGVCAALRGEMGNFGPGQPRVRDSESVVAHVMDVEA